MTIPINWICRIIFWSDIIAPTNILLASDMNLNFGLWIEIKLNPNF